MEAVVFAGLQASEKSSFFKERFFSTHVRISLDLLKTRNREEREAINAPIQGTAADIMKIAMLHLSKSLQKSGLSAHMLLQVHDELVLECRVDQIAETIQLVREVMESAYSLDIPLHTDARFGKNWGKLETANL